MSLSKSVEDRVKEVSSYTARDVQKYCKGLLKIQHNSTKIVDSSGDGGHIYQCIKEMMKSMTESASDYHELSVDLLEVASSSLSGTPESGTSVWSPAITKFLSHNNRSMTRLHDTIADIARQPEPSSSHESRISPLNLIKLIQLNRFNTISISIILRDIAELSNKLSTRLWKTSLAYTKTEPSNDQLVLLSDSHDIMAMHNDMSEFDQQTVLSLKANSEATDSNMEKVAERVFAINRQRTQTVEGALFRLAKSHIALLTTFALVTGTRNLTIQTDTENKEICEGNIQIDQIPQAPLPSNDDMIISSYSCAILKKGFPVHGRMSLTRSSVCFASPLLSGDVKIAFTSIQNVHKEKLALMLPNSLKITDAECVRTFTSFLNLDQALQSIQELLRIHRAIAVAVLTPRAVFKNQCEVTPELTSVSNNTGERNNSDVEKTIDGDLKAGPEPIIMLKSAVEVIANQTDKISHVLSVKICCPSNQLIQLMTRQSIWTTFLERDGHTAISISDWTSDEISGHQSRVITSTRSLGSAFAAFGVSQAMLSSIHRFGYNNEHMAIYQIETTCSGIPYSDCFTVYIQIEIGIGSEGREISLEIGVEPRFIKKTLLKGTITKNVERHPRNTGVIQNIPNDSRRKIAQFNCVGEHQYHGEQSASLLFCKQLVKVNRAQALAMFVIAVMMVALLWLLIGKQGFKPEGYELSSQMLDIKQQLDTVAKDIKLIKQLIDNEN